jgi:PAS domain S-box-containing protein
MKFGIKQKILLVFIGALALTTGLTALLASYFTNRQNEQTAFTDLERDLRTWTADLHTLTKRLREVALDAVGDAVILNQLAELVTLELNLDGPAEIGASSEAMRTLAYAKSVSLNRLHLVLRTGGFSSVAVYTGGRLSHYVSASEAGMMIRRAGGRRVWVQASADSQGQLPLQNWPAWNEAAPTFASTPPPPQLGRAAVAVSLKAPRDAQIEIAIPVQGVSEEVAIDVAHSRTRFVSELAIANPAPAPANNPTSRPASTVAVVVFHKVIDRAALELVARQTGKLPVLFSIDGKHRQQLADTATAQDLWDVQALQAAVDGHFIRRTVTTSQGSFYQALLPWHFEGDAGVILGLASSRASTLQNIRQTVAAILTVASVVLLLSISFGTFWVNRFINPIVALTAAAKKMDIQRRLHREPAAGDDSTEELRRIADHAPDEVGDLAHAFNTMIAELRQSFETLEQRVQGRTAELRQQTRYLRALIDTLPLLVWLKDTKSRYLAANQAAADACGRTVEDMVGKSDLDIWPREIAEGYMADDADAMRTRQRKTVEEPLPDVKGPTWIETYKAPVLDEDGTVLGTVGAARDISERKAAEAAREAALSEAERLATLRSEFLAQMSHELRTPLNAILGYAQILRRDEHLTERQARGLATIEDSGHHLLTLINDILDLSRISASRLELYPADTDLAVFLRTVCDIIRVKAEEKGLLFTYQGSPDLPPTVRIDDKRLRQVLLNLLGNAVKFTDSGRIQLRVTKLAGPGEKTGIATARLLFEVEDSGIGMSGHQMEKIFLPFEQVADAKRRHGGTGLGLAISRQLVRVMGGDIQVESELGRGSTFRFELDVPIAESELSTVPAGQIATGYVGTRRKILLVDDVQQSRQMLQDLLATLGFDIVEAANGEEALHQAQRVRPDLVVMDIGMPVMDGLEATRKMRLTPEFAHLPVLIASASATSEDEARSLAAGANAFIPKPIDRERLLKTIGEHLAVEWIYEDSAPDAQSATIPPLAEMETLYKLALTGNMRDIRDRANYLQETDPRYSSFVQRLQSLAQRYQSQAILALVERYRAQAVLLERSADLSTPTDQPGSQ